MIIQTKSYSCANCLFARNISDDGRNNAGAEPPGSRRAVFCSPLRWPCREHGFGKRLQLKSDA
jgi:hypothetical protein